EVPARALHGAQTQRAVENFPISGQRMPAEFVRSLALVKWAAAESNAQLGLLPKKFARPIAAAALCVWEGEHSDEFPVDVFQTGSGTSSNMNMNEVLANLASQRIGAKVSPNDHVNMGQSSNDVIPTTIHVAAAIALRSRLLPELKGLARALARKARSVRRQVKTGRTHLMDAMPVRMDQEIDAWRTQIEKSAERLEAVMPRLCQLAQGGTAVGSGINAHPRFAMLFARTLGKKTKIRFVPNPSFFEALACQDTAVELSGQLKTTAVGFMKIANDLRWMNSGPLAGLGEIELAALQPGSSIMPGKVNPVIPEAAAMVAAQVIGNDAAITTGGGSGNFQLNVMLPLIARNLLESIRLLAATAPLLAATVAGFKVRTDQLREPLARNPILVTALNPVIGYLKAAEIAKAAYRQGRPVVDVAAEMTDIPRRDLEKLLNPADLTKGGISG
ncbi:MAG: class II fumarate hydratase, partial [Betaproteobacteria bacterium]|nr:class II fumarate hydratase [Betaproteobacteria bacterium]